MRLIFLFLLLASPMAITAPLRINVFGGHPHGEGGGGDVASNVWMARLFASDPELEVRVLVTAENYDIIRNLVGLKSEPPIQTIGNVTFHLIQKVPEEAMGRVPPSDFTYYFAKHWKAPMPDILRQGGGRVITAQEYYHHAASSDTYPFVSDAGERVNGIRVNTGPKALGLYIGHGGEKLLGQTVAPKEVFGFAYSSMPDASVRYLEAVAKIAQSPRYAGKELVVYVKEFPGLKDVPLPANLKLKTYTWLSGADFEAMIRDSQLPPLLTGDVSASFAIQLGKPFLYEQPYWKEFFSQALAERLEPHLTSDQRKKFEKMMQIRKLIDGRDGNVDFRHSLDEMVDWLTDADLHANIAKGYRDLIGNQSLRDFFVRYMQLAHQEKDRLDHLGNHALTDAAYYSHSLPAAKEYLRQVARELERRKDSPRPVYRSTWSGRTEGPEPAGKPGTPERTAWNVFQWQNFADCIELLDAMANAA